MWSPALAASSTTSIGTMSSSVRTIRCTNGASSERMGSGTPSISLMTFIGRSIARSAITSCTPSKRPTSSSVSRAMFGRRSSTVFGVNALATSPRSRVWSGGFIPRIDRVRRSKVGKRWRHSSSLSP